MTEREAGADTDASPQGWGGRLLRFLNSIAHAIPREERLIVTPLIITGAVMGTIAWFVEPGVRYVLAIGFVIVSVTTTFTAAKHKSNTAFLDHWAKMAPPYDPEASTKALSEQVAEVRQDLDDLRRAQHEDDKLVV